MKHVRLTLAVLLAAVVLSSCNKKALDALRTENATLKQLNEDIRVELAECNASSKSLSERIAAEQKRLEEKLVIIFFRLFHILYFLNISLRFSHKILPRKKIYHLLEMND